MNKKVRVTKQFKFETGHALYGYDGLCKNVHGHSYKLDVTIIGKPIVDIKHVKNGMVIDFGDLKTIVNQEIIEPFDHATVLNVNSPHAEIADEMEMSEERLTEWEAAFQANTPQSIDSVYDQFSIWFASSDNNPEQEVNEVELQKLLKKALTELPEREALVIQLYYVEELNVFEIAEVLEVSTGRVSQIKKSAIVQLRQFIEKANQVD